MIKRHTKSFDSTNKIILSRMGKEMMIKAFNPTEEKPEQDEISLAPMGNFNFNLFKKNSPKKQKKNGSLSLLDVKPKIFNRTMNIKLTRKRHKSEILKRRNRQRRRSWLGKGKDNLRDSFMPEKVKKYNRRPFIQEKIQEKNKIYEEVCKTLEKGSFNKNKNDPLPASLGDKKSSLSQNYYNNRRLAYHHKKNANFFKKMRKKLFTKAKKNIKRKTLEFDRKRIIDTMQRARLKTDVHMESSGSEIQRMKLLLDSIHQSNTKKFWEKVKADRIHTHPTNYRVQTDVNKRTLRKPEPIEYPLRSYTASSFQRKRYDII